MKTGVVEFIKKIDGEKKETRAFLLQVQCIHRVNNIHIYKSIRVRAIKRIFY